MKTPYGSMPNNKITITRGNQKELDQAISDLEERGWEVVKRDEGVTTTYRKDYNYKDNIGSKYKYAGDSAGFPKCKAELRKVVEV
jgi:predicted  nucleic acid-binding Zn ribbon protein